MLNNLVIVLVPALEVHNEQRLSVGTLDLDLDHPLAPDVLGVSDVDLGPHIDYVHQLLSFDPLLVLLLLLVPLVTDYLLGGRGEVHFRNHLLDHIIHREATHKLLVSNHLITEEADL